MSRKKNTMPAIPMSTGSGIVSKVVGVAMLLAVLTLVVKHPAEAAEWAKTVFGWLEAAVDGLANFIRELS